MKSKDIDDALALLFADAVKKAENVDPRTNAAGYESAINAVLHLATEIRQQNDAAVVREIDKSLAGLTMPATIIGKESW